MSMTEPLFFDPMLLIIATAWEFQQNRSGRGLRVRDYGHVDA
jgi:hypothetical protein